jgi:BCCT family betaine/carnitine transporter
MSTNTNPVQTDWLMFSATLAIIILVCVPIVGFNQEAGAIITQAYDLITQQFGILYIWYGIGAVSFLIWLALSRYGNVKLGEKESKPEFKTLSWVGMLFCAGIGAGLLYWAVIEWGYYIDTPPYGIEPRSTKAIEWAASYGLFHWGISAWAFYCLPTLAIAYPYYVRKIPYLRLSTACSSYLPATGVNSKRARFIDFLYMLNLIGGSGTSLGLSTPMIAASFAELLNLEHNFVLEVMVVLFCIAIFGTSAFLGLQKGFKKLADLNMFIALTLLFFVLAVGPTIFILKMGTNSIGLVLNNFIHMNFWTDPVENTGFVESWTIFYWAWWVAYGPFVGIFVARISYGRTIKQVVFGMLTFGSLGAWLFFIVFGNYAMYLELNGLLQITDMMKSGSKETAAAISQVFTSLPLGKLALTAFAIVSVVFLATTYDSASYTLASVSSKRLEAGQDPARWNRVFWAFALGVLPVSLMFIDGGLKVILSTTIVVSLPLLALGLIMAMSLMKMLKEDYEDNHT